MLLTFVFKTIVYKTFYLLIIGASSDMIIIDLNSNPNNKKVGDLIEFKFDYMGALRLIYSKYIDKKVIDE
jgi:predicted amino acid racemase